MTSIQKRRESKSLNRNMKREEKVEISKESEKVQTTTGSSIRLSLEGDIGTTIV